MIQHSLFSSPKPQPLFFNNRKLTLWMGNLEAWMDERYLQDLWASIGENVVVKLMRDKRTSISEGYAFIGFGSNMAAQRALATIHGTQIPDTNLSFKLNWASGGGIQDKKEDRLEEFSLFVGDLDTEVDETYLLSFFQHRYPSCHSAKIMTYPTTGQSRGFGFVRFHDPIEQQEAMIEMSGMYCKNRPLRVSLATPKNNQLRYQQLSLKAPALIQQPTSPNNTTIFVGGLLSAVTEDELRCYFSPFGEINYVKIPPNKSCGFIQFVSRLSAEVAMEQMNGFQIGSSRIRLSWGRTQQEKPHGPLAFAYPPHSTAHQDTNVSYTRPQQTFHSTHHGIVDRNPMSSYPTSVPPGLCTFHNLSPPNSFSSLDFQHSPTAPFWNNKATQVPNTQVRLGNGLYE
ncbi:hypothetical protein CLU79DRAFT_747123 [Phycomyces nitens]|nr:hypothetical protein CLU79DRAFT_747123 [Phycomyces nitens]